MSPHRFRATLPWLLLAAAVLAATGVLDTATSWAGPRQLQRANTEYLDQSFERALGTFAVLSAVKAALAVVEGSEVGVGFGLELGDAVQATYDYIDIAWRTVLAGAVVLLGMKYALQTVTAADHWVLALALLAGALSMLLSRRTGGWRFGKRVSRDTARVMAVAAVALYVLAPLSVTGASLLSRRITAPVSGRAHERIELLKAELARYDTNGGLLEELRATPERIRAVTAYLATESRSLGQAVVRLIAGYLFDCIVFPLGLFAAAFFLTRAASRYLLSLGASESLAESLRDSSRSEVRPAHQLTPDMLGTAAGHPPAEA